MNKHATHTIYEQVVSITNVYLGPAAERFISRQVENHLRKSPDKLSADDLETLIDWIRVVVSLLTEDSEIIEEYASELQKLVDANKPSQRNLENK